MGKKLWLLCLLVLCACTYLPDMVAAPTPAPCPTMPPCPPAVTVVAPTEIPLASATVEPAPTATGLPTEALPTSAPLEGGHAPDAARLPFVVEVGMPRLEQNFAHPDQGCDWIGVAGQVLDEQGEAITGQVIVVSGVMNDQVVDGVSLSGAVGQYGPGGYEIRLPAQLAVSSQLHLQLLDLDGAPLSDPVLFDPPGSCERTLVLVNFRFQP